MDDDEHEPNRERLLSDMTRPQGSVKRPDQRDRNRQDRDDRRSQLCRKPEDDAHTEGLTKIVTMTSWILAERGWWVRAWGGGVGGGARGQRAGGGVGLKLLFFFFFFFDCDEGVGCDDEESTPGGKSLFSSCMATRLHVEVSVWRRELGIDDQGVAFCDP